MIEEAYHSLHRLEEKHWWYVGARESYRTLLDIGQVRGGPAPRRILEVGSGTGGNFELLSDYGSLVALEFSAEALLLAPKTSELGQVRASADRLPFEDRSFDFVALFGLIEHMEDDLGTLREAARVCRSGGAVALLTSALPILWSHHDEANRHFRRYTRPQLQNLLASADLAPIRVSYQNFFTLLPVLAVRLWQRRTRGEARYDMGTVPESINRVLIQLLRFEAWWLRFATFPIGVDLVAVAKPAAD